MQITKSSQLHVALQDILYFYMQNLNTVASLWSWAGWIESDLVSNPEDWFSCDEAHLIP